MLVIWGWVDAADLCGLVVTWWATIAAAGQPSVAACTSAILLAAAVNDVGSMCFLLVCAWLQAVATEADSTFFSISSQVGIGVYACVPLWVCACVLVHAGVGAVATCSSCRVCSLLAGYEGGLRCVYPFRPPTCMAEPWGMAEPVTQCTYFHPCTGPGVQVAGRE